VKKIAEKWKIWNKRDEVAKSEEETKKLISQRFHKWIYIFKKKVSERIPTKKVDHIIEVKKEFVLRKKKVYPLLREKREEMYKFIEEQLRKVSELQIVDFILFSIFFYFSFY